VSLHHRDALDAVQRALRDEPGVTVLIYDQLCATEKRRRRKRGTLPPPPERVFIHPRICEGCGDCSVQSNCLAIVPLDTPFGRKRQIDQSACNVDRSCIKGFCPSFITVSGGEDTTRTGALRTPPSLPAVEPPPLGERPFNLVIAGIGGSGIVTLSAILGVAAMLEGHACLTIDQTGLAQKGGAVVSMLRLARAGLPLHAARVPSAEADVLLACDLVVSAQPEILATIAPERSFAFLNTHKTMTGEFARDADFELPADALQATIEATLGGADFLCRVDVVAAAETLLGDTIGANMMLLGAAFQSGRIPLGQDALTAAIRLNGAAVDLNLAAFAWGRAAIAAPALFAAALAPVLGPSATEQSLDGLVAHYAEDLARYQNAAYAERYRALVETVRSAEDAAVPGEERLSEAVARNAYRLMAYKDEYEIARLMSETDFLGTLQARFGAGARLGFHLAPPGLAPRDPASGLPRKRRFGAWMRPVFRLLRHGKILRGTPFDIFGYSAERAGERALLQAYEAEMRALAAALTPQTHAAAVALARLPEKIRGFGHVKARALTALAPEREKLRDILRLAEPS
jgi:indolepyruvate ferredoxin oxidoreductase